MSHTVQQRMGGDGTSLTIDQNIMAFLVNEPAPENANKGAALTALRSAARGVPAGAVRHVPQRQHAHEPHRQNVKSANTDDNTMVQGFFDVPSLLGIARTAPYLHDGRFQTLEERVAEQDDNHGAMSSSRQTTGPRWSPT